MKSKSLFGKSIILMVELMDTDPYMRILFVKDVETTMMEVNAETPMHIMYLPKQYYPYIYISSIK